MFPLLEAIRKIARYTPQAWGGTMAEVGAPQGNFLGQVGAELAAPTIAEFGIGKMVGKAVAGKVAPVVGEVATLGYQAAQAGGKTRAASRYGNQLGKQNPYLAAGM